MMSVFGRLLKTRQADISAERERNGDVGLENDRRSATGLCGRKFKKMYGGEWQCLRRRRVDGVNARGSCE
jgi:hypothetical protein